MLAARSWPGNVRELRNFIERSVLLGFVTGPARRTAQPLPRGGGLEAMVPVHLPLKDARQAWTESFENVYVRSLLEKTEGNVTHAAELAGVNRRFLQRLIARLGIRAGDVGADPRSSKGTARGTATRGATRPDCDRRDAAARVRARVARDAG